MNIPESKSSFKMFPEGILAIRGNRTKRIIGEKLKGSIDIHLVYGDSKKRLPNFIIGISD